MDIKTRIKHHHTPKRAASIERSVLYWQGYEVELSQTYITDLKSTWCFFFLNTIKHTVTAQPSIPHVE